MLAQTIYDLRLPRNATALMQHLQRLVGVELYRYWCGGTIATEKLPAFLNKMSARYPITRNARGRAYDRSRGRAAMHMVVYVEPHEFRARSYADCVPNPARDRAHRAGAPASAGSAQTMSGPPLTVWWWLVSTEGVGGLADTGTPDAHVARDAMGADSHIVFGDYVLLYATKKEPKAIKDLRTGRTREVLAEKSSWTWKIRSDVIAQVRAAVDQACARDEYGAETSDGRPGWGLRGILAAQRQRPLFSGVRTQVLDLHKHAEERWARSRPRWLKAHPELASRYKGKAGALRPLTTIVREFLPKMTRHRVYDDPPFSVADLLHAVGLSEGHGRWTVSEGRRGRTLAGVSDDVS